MGYTAALNTTDRSPFILFPPNGFFFIFSRLTRSPGPKNSFLVIYGRYLKNLERYFKWLWVKNSNRRAVIFHSLSYLIYGKKMKNDKGVERPATTFELIKHESCLMVVIKKKYHARKPRNVWIVLPKRRKLPLTLVVTWPHPTMSKQTETEESSRCYRHRRRLSLSLSANRKWYTVFIAPRSFISFFPPTLYENSCDSISIVSLRALAFGWTGKTKFNHAHSFLSWPPKISFSLSPPPPRSFVICSPDSFITIFLLSLHTP